MSMPAAKSVVPFGSKVPPAVLGWIVGTTDFDQPHIVTGLRRKIAKRFLRWTNTEFDVTYRGLRFRLLPNDNAGDLEIAMYGKHGEEDELVIFEDLIKSADVFIDIGANIGVYSLTAARHMPVESTIVAFEPAPSTRDRFEQNIALNGFENRISVAPVGVGPEAGSFTLARGKSYNAGSASLLPSKATVSAGQTVDVVTLISELEARGIGKIDVLKIDIEGFEDQALVPFFDAAPAELWPSYVMLETCHHDKWQSDLMKLLSDAGYTVSFENARNRHYRRGTSS